MKPRVQAFTAMSAHHHRALLLSWLDCVRKARATNQIDSKKIKDSFQRIIPPHVIVTFKHRTVFDPRENGLTTGLQSRPSTLLEQPPTWYHLWCLYWLFLLLFFWLLYWPSHLWRWCHALDLMAHHLLCHQQPPWHTHSNLHAPPLLWQIHEHECIHGTLQSIQLHV